jgi:hypothetical protein
MTFRGGRQWTTAAEVLCEGNVDVVFLFKILIDSAAGVLLPNKSLQDRTSCG